jgi:hypothetical protein
MLPQLAPGVGQKLESILMVHLDSVAGRMTLDDIDEHPSFVMKSIFVVDELS